MHARNDQLEFHSGSQFDTFRMHNNIAASVTGFLIVPFYFHTTGYVWCLQL